MWIKKGNYNSITEYLTGVSGCTLEELERPASVPASSIQNLKAAAQMIYSYAQNEDAKVVIVGDYDADGLTSTAMLTMLLEYLWITPTPIIPRRFTDGYGINAGMIADVKNSLIITVDNGISTAPELFESAHRSGNKIIVLDHHLAPDVMPHPDVMVDPHIEPEKNGFVDYCAAGLVLKLAELMVNTGAGTEAETLMNNLRVLACIGTLADAMPLLGDNRRIVKDGLALINSNAYHTLNAGIRALLRVKEEPCDEDTIRFSIAPMLNAPPRLFDRGGNSVLKALRCKDDTAAATYAEKMLTINDERKRLVKEWVDRSVAEMEKDGIGSAIVLYIPGMPDGINGIIAGKLSKEYGRPTFIFADVKGDESVLKCSARAPEGWDLTGAMEDIHSLVVRSGGHAMAAGLTIQKDMFESVRDRITAFMDANQEKPDANAVYYDCDIAEEDVPEALELLKRYAPYGMGIERPVFRIRNFHAVPKYGKSYYALMGKEKDHLRLTGEHVNAIGFFMAEEYMLFGAPDEVGLIANITENRYNGKCSPQLRIIEFGEPEALASVS